MMVMEDLRNKENRSLYWAILIFICLAAGIVIIGYQFYSHYKEKFRLELKTSLPR